MCRLRCSSLGHRVRLPHKGCGLVAFLCLYPGRVTLYRGFILSKDAFLCTVTAVPLGGLVVIPPSSPLLAVLATDIIIIHSLLVQGLLLLLLPLQPSPAGHNCPETWHPNPDRGLQLNSIFTILFILSHVAFLSQQSSTALLTCVRSACNPRIPPTRRAI